MITEKDFSDNPDPKKKQEEQPQEEKKPIDLQENLPETVSEPAIDDAEPTTEVEEISAEKATQEPPTDEPIVEENTEEGLPIVTHVEETEEESEEELQPEADNRSIAELTGEMEKILNQKDAGKDFKIFNHLKTLALAKIQNEKEEKKHAFVSAGNAEENFSWDHPYTQRINILSNLFKEKHDDYQKVVEENQVKNLEERQSIIERLKNLYTNSEVGTNLFREIRLIKEDWKKAGQVAKSEFKILNNNYFHHLNQFYQMLDLNKEYLGQEYAHNLETRQHIIERAKQLENEPVVQKALNELQYLHKLWKEEAEPVAEEFREKTWEEFKEISNKIHARKGELTAQLEVSQQENLSKKEEIIAAIKGFSEPGQNNHNFWQNAIKKVEELRSEFLKIGSVPKKLSNQNWNDFKVTLREFNAKKNEFYKGLKGSQQTNLEEKLKLIQTAKDNMLSEDWETTVPLFKKLQEDWKKIGHVPRNMANKVWDDFRDACNTFFDNFRDKNKATNDNWKDNYNQKFKILEELKTIGEDESSVLRIEALKTAWNNIGKVPKDKLSINTEFNKVLKEKLKLNKINEFELKEEGLSENQLTDKARKLKSQISDLEAEILKLETNLSFFNNPNRENPLLKDTFDTIDEKRSQLENLKVSLHNIITGE